MNVNDHIRRLEERLVAWDAEIVRLNSALQLEKDKNETLQKSYSRVLQDHSKTAKHIRKARRDKKALQERLKDSERNANEYAKRFHQKEADCDELVTSFNQLKERYDEVVTDATELKAKNKELGDINKKWNEIYTKALDKNVEIRSEAEDFRERSIACELENTELQKDVLKLVRMLPLK